MIAVPQMNGMIGVPAMSGGMIAVPPQIRSTAAQNGMIAVAAIVPP